MRLLELFLRSKPPSAPAAKERLQILMAHERAGRSGPDYLPKLHKELLRVIAKYIRIDEEKVSVHVEEADGVSMLEVNIELPGPAMAARR
ncbi:MAG: cell division topological specificity factor MinE [Alphaproteobacteria bacterium]